MPSLLSPPAPAARQAHEHSVARILAALAHAPDRAVLQGPGYSLAAGELARAVAAAGRGLAVLGAGRGHAVGILTATNSAATLVARYAAHLVGAPAVCVRSSNPRAGGAQLAREHQALLLRRAGTCVLVVDAEHADRGRQLLADLGGRPALAALSPLGPDVADLAGAGRHGPAQPVPAPRLPDDLAVVGTTSGTTGPPRATCHSVRAWESTVRSFPAVGEDGQPGVLLVVTPISHTVAPMVDAVLAAGGRVVVHEDFDAARVWSTIGDERVTDVYVAVPHLHRLLDVAAAEPVDPSSLRRLVYSGSPAAPRRVAEAVRLLGAALVQLYGTTEAGGIANLTPLDHAEPELLGTVGRPFPWVQLELRAPGGGAAVPRGGIGEVWVSSPTVMDGYAGDAASTSRVLRDGWLNTGDLGRWNRYGYLELVGRTDDVIKSGGVKIHPATVERVLLAHPDIAGAAAFAAPGPDDVEAVHAALVLRPGSVCETGEVQSFVSARLDPLHAPATVTVWEQLPLTASGKPDRAALLAHVRRRTAQEGRR